MANLMEMLKGELPESILNQIGQTVGADQDQTQTAVESAMTAILSGLSKNVQSEDGASSLLKALDRDHDGSILSDIGGYLQGNANVSNSNALNGAGILSHVLGNNQSGVVEMIAKLSGLDKSKSGQMLVTLAPVIMGLLGKMKQKHEVSNNNLLDLITKTAETQQVNTGLGGIFTKMLDKDGDGGFMDDIAEMGVKSLLGGFFKK